MITGTKTRSSTGGGQEHAEFFLITSGAVVTPAELVYDLQEETQINSNILVTAGQSVSLNGVANDEDLASYIEDHTKDDITGSEEITLEGGNKRTAPGASVVSQVAIFYGPASGGKIQTFVVVCETQSEGDITWKDKTFARRPLQAIGQKWNGTGAGTASALVVPTTAFNSSIVDATDAQIAADAVEIAVDSIGVELWIDAA